MLRKLTPFILLLILAAQRSSAAVILVGNYSLLPNTPDQKITIPISGNEAVAGVDLFAQIGDGGVFNAGVNAGPTITNIDLVTNTPFAPNNSGQAIDPTQASHPLVWATGLTTNAGSVTLASDSILATLTIDTTGITQGEFDLLLSGVSANTAGPFDTQLTDAQGQPIPLTISNGRISIAVPEPGTLAALSLAALSLLRRRRLAAYSDRNPD